MSRRPTLNEIAYLRRASVMLELPTSTWATSIALFHRYCRYVGSSKLKVDPLPSQIAMLTCIYLATKVTEEPRKQRDIANVGHKLEHPTSEFLSVNSTTLSALRRSLTQGELIMMRALGFDFNVELPHVWITSIIYGMAWWERNGEPPDDMETVDIRIKRIAQAAWRIANKAVECGLVDTEPARLLGAACVAIAMEFHKEKLPAKDNNEWAEIWAGVSGRQLGQIRKLIEKSMNLSLVLSSSSSNMSTL